MSNTSVRPQPIATIARRTLTRGLAAGVLGTALMTGWQELVAKMRAPAEADGEPAEGSPQDPWKDAPAPAKVAEKLSDALLNKQISPERIPLLTNLMHWSYGTSWGALYGLGATVTRRRSGLTAGAWFGTAVWAMSYVQLVPMGLYDPPWKTPPKELALDLSYHLVYGTAAASAYRLLD